MSKIALVSDVHLGTRQYGIRERYEDFLQAFRNVGKSIIEHKVDSVIIGGDLFDSPRPDARSVLAAQTVVSDLTERGINVYGIDGNHDLADGGWLYVIGANPIHDMTPMPIAGGLVMGINYKNGRDLVAQLQEMVDIGLEFKILVAHFALAEMNGGGSADTGVQELSPLLDKLGVKCVLMGHVHIPDSRKWNGVLYVNPGSTEMKSSNEPKEKFYFIVDTDTWTAEPVPIKTRTVEEVEIESESDLIGFQNRLEQENARNMAGLFSKDVDESERTFYQVVADDSIDDAFKRLAKAVHDTGAIARIVVRSSKARDLAPVVDRNESVATLESAIEARFPKESAEAKLTADLLHSPDPASIHIVCDRFMKGEK